jgi:arylsulfatase A-like enzyme
MAKQKNRREFLRAGVAAGLSGAAAFGSAPGVISARNRDGRPNVVLVTMDTTRYDRLGFNNYERPTSPYLDGIANEGFVFNRNYVQAPYTAPSIASFMTSLYPSELKRITNRRPRIDESFDTLATLFKTRGYHTTGVTGVFMLNHENGFGRGFDNFSSPTGAPSLANLWGPKAVRRADASGRWFLETVMRTGDMATPQFFWLHFYDAHVPYCAPETYTSRFHTEGNFDNTVLRAYGHLEAPDGTRQGDRAGSVR